jgi:hypothetical protein
MKYVVTISTTILLLWLATPPAFAEGAGNEWEVLNQEVMELYRAGEYGDAVVVAKKALEVAEKNLGPDHPQVATSLNKLAELHRAQGQYARAEPPCKRALAIWEKALGPDHPLWPWVSSTWLHCIELRNGTKKPKRWSGGRPVFERSNDESEDAGESSNEPRSSSPSLDQ